MAAVMALVAVMVLLPRRRRGIYRLAGDTALVPRVTGSLRVGRKTRVPLGLVGWSQERRAAVRPASWGSRSSVPSFQRPGLRLTPAALLVVVLGTSMGAKALVSLLASGVVLVVVFGLRSRQRRRRTAAGRRSQVIEACGVLAADLRAGRTPRDALEAAATVCGDLEVAAAAARLGGDVAAALDLAARSPGAAGLRALGAAWRVADRSGAAFATIVERLADSLRADESLRRQVSAGLAGTRSTARLLAGLPLFATAVGYGIGADPVTFLIGSPMGWACLFIGLALAVAGLAWVERLAEACEGDR
jgi:tight adherence protein B